jgi:hypothetical protein
MPEFPEDPFRATFSPLRDEALTQTQLRATIERSDAESRARRRRTRRVATLSLPVVAGIFLAVALAPTGGTDHGPAVSAVLPQRAEAAISPPNQILQLTIRLERTWSGQAGTDEVVRKRQWTLTGTGRALLARALITEGAFEQPPTDEDTTTVIDRDGEIVDMRSWTPTGTGARGRLELLESRLGERVDSQTLAASLLIAYERRLLRPAGTTPDGKLRLVGKLYPDQCSHAEVLLDRHTFIPRTIETVSRSMRRDGTCRDDAPALRETQTITARTLPTTAANRRLLQIGDWPVASRGRLRLVERRVPHSQARTVHTDFTPLARLPMPPPLDED